MTPLLAFGVPRLDDAFASESPGQPMLITNEPGVDHRPFVVQAVATAIAAGRRVVYLGTDRAPRLIVQSIRDAGADVSKCRILDAHSSLQGFADGDHTLVDAANVADVVRHIEQAHSDDPDALFVLDSLNGLTMRGDLPQFVAAIPRLAKAMERFPEAIATFTEWNVEVALQPLIAAFPHRVRLHAVHDRIITHQYFSVDRISGRNGDRSPVLYRADGGAVRVYVPKLVITGPGDAGKSTFVHAVSDRAVSADRMGATVAMDKGTIDQGGLRVEIFGTPGQERFDAIITPILRQAVGVILMVDSDDPASFARASEMLRRTWRNGLHAVVAANKQDLPGALSPEQVAEGLDLPPGVAVLPCQATDAAQAKQILDHILDRILSSQDVIQ